MLGHSHTLSGLAVGAATVPYAPVHGPGQSAAWVVAVGGMAMLPDLDQRNSTIARSWGPLTAVPSEVVGKLAGGHRNGTHSAIGIAVVYLLAELANMAYWSSLVMIALAVGLGMRALAFVIPGRSEETVAFNLLVSFSVAWWVLDTGRDTTWLPFAVALGAATHIAGDAITERRVPLLWPFTKKRFGLGLFTTGHLLWEGLVAGPGFAAMAVWFCDQHNVAGVTALVDGLGALVPGQPRIYVAFAFAGVVVTLAYRHGRKKTRARRDTTRRT